MNPHALVATLAVFVLTFAGCSTKPPVAEHADHADSYELQIVSTVTEENQAFTITTPSVIASEPQAADEQNGGN